MATKAEQLRERVGKIAWDERYLDRRDLGQGTIAAIVEELGITEEMVFCQNVEAALLPADPRMRNHRQAVADALSHILEASK